MKRESNTKVNRILALFVAFMLVVTMLPMNNTKVQAAEYGSGDILKYDKANGGWIINPNDEKTSLAVGDILNSGLKIQVVKESYIYRGYYLGVGENSGDFHSDAEYTLPYSYEVKKFSTDGQEAMYATLIPTELTGEVSISGTLSVNETLTATYSGGNSGSAAGHFTYQWYRDSDAIVHATNKYYVLQQDDRGCDISVKIIGDGAYFCGTIESNAVRITLELEGMIKVSGSYSVGETLITEYFPIGGDAPTFTYQWYRDEEPIDGATSSTYTVLAEDAAHCVWVEAIGTGDYTGSVPSSKTMMVSNGHHTAGTLSYDKSMSSWVVENNGKKAIVRAEDELKSGINLKTSSSSNIYYDGELVNDSTSVLPADASVVRIYDDKTGNKCIYLLSSSPLFGVSQWTKVTEEVSEIIPENNSLTPEEAISFAAHKINSIGDLSDLAVLYQVSGDDINYVHFNNGIFKDDDPSKVSIDSINSIYSTKNVYVIGTYEPVQPSHSWTYAAEDNKIIATCDKACGETTAHTVTLTLLANNASYSGNAVTAKYRDGEEAAWKAALGTDAPAITYEYKATADGTYAVTAETKEVGYYRASVTVDTNKTATVEYRITNLSQEAPATGEGFTINYLAETITAQEGYEVSTSNETLIAPTDGKVIPGTTYYVRKAAKTNYDASEWISNTVAVRPEAPIGLEGVDPTTVGGTDGKITGVAATMEYSVNDGTSWNDVTGTEITGLSAGTVLVRVKATESAFAGANAEVTHSNPHAHVLGTHHEAVPGNCTDKGTIEYYDCAVVTCKKKLDSNGNELTSIEGSIDPENHKGTATTWIKTDATHKEIYDCCGAVKTAEAAHTYGTTGADRYTCTVCSCENATKKAEAELADAKLAAKAALDAEDAKDPLVDKSPVTTGKTNIDAATTKADVESAKIAALEAIRAAQANKPDPTPTPEPIIIIPQQKSTPTPEPTQEPGTTQTPEPTQGSEKGNESGATEEYRATVESDEDSVQVNAKIKGGIAAVEEISEELLKDMFTKDSSDTEDELRRITINLSEAKQTVKGIELTKQTVTNLADAVSNSSYSADSVEVVMGGVTVELDAKTLETIRDNMAGDTIRLVVEKNTNESLNDNQKNALEKCDVAEMIDVYIESNGVRIHDFKGGNVTISVEFTPEKGKKTKNYRVYYIDDDGKLKKHATKYENGKLTFVTSHFSDYVVIYDNVQDVLLAQAETTKKGYIKLSWNEIEGAAKYVVYGAKCGKSYKQIAELDAADGDTFTVKKLNGAKPVSGKTYKLYVVAYDALGNEVKSKAIHYIAGDVSAKYANVKTITPVAKTLELTVGEKLAVGAEYAMYEDKKHTPEKHGKALRFTSDCPEVAKVSKNGTVTAKSAGTAAIYIQDISGKWCQVEVTVK